MRVFFKNTQLFPIDSGHITYAPEDESSPERASQMKPLVSQEMKRSSLCCLMGVFDYYSRSLIYTRNASWHYIYPEGAKLMAPKPTILPPNPAIPSNPAKDPYDLPKNPNEAEKQIKFELQKSSNDAEAVSVVTASNGIMLISKLPFTQQEFEEFTATAGEDKRAAKGFVTVQMIDLPWLAFAHLQDDYNREAEHANIREKQISQMIDSLERDGKNGIIMAELMVRGDKDRITPDGEWDLLFGKTAINSPTKGFQDCWDRYMVPPGVAPNAMDQGYTAIDRALNQEMRVAYVLLRNESYAPYHISMPLGLHDGSDRYGVSLEFGVKRPHCSPSDAIVVAFGQNLIESVSLTFDGESGPQWIYIKESGTYSIVTADIRFEWEVYALSDLSIPLVYEEEADLSESAQFAEVNERARGYVRGKVYAPSQPFLIKASLKTSHSTFSGPQTLLVVRHDGGTRGTAITIKPNAGVYQPSFPSAKPLPPKDTLWLRAPAPKVLSDRATQNEFLVSAGASRNFKFQFEGDATLFNTSSGDLKFSRVMPSGSISYLLVTRPDFQHDTFSISWKSDVSYLRLDRPFFLHIDDETGADWAGDDEVTLWLADEAGTDFFEASFLDADTGDNFNLTNRKLLDAITALGHSSSSISFVEKVDIRVREDDFDDDNQYPFSILAMQEKEGDQVQRVLELPIQSGKYSLKFTLSRRERI
jgi:hypothetical protein